MKKAGSRTIGIVSIGSAIYVLLSCELAHVNNIDVSRIISQVITGVGFLCAGVIFRQGATVQGLTTAATVWCSSAVGCLAAAGYFEKAALCTLVIIFINGVLRNVDNWIERKRGGIADQNDRI
jgi:putative Mg2+ transporter-C (MgtC) family protein